MPSAATPAIRTPPRSGFTLVEISIVLVIIGLIVGGILVGRDLIKAAEIRGTISQYEGFGAAVNTFRLKYGGLPGDLQDPARFGFPAPLSTAWVVRGDGKLSSSNGAQDSSHIIPGAETTHFWYQLSASQLIKAGFAAPPAHVLAGVGSPIYPETIRNYFPSSTFGRNNFWFVHNNGGKNYYSLFGMDFIEYVYDGASLYITPQEAYGVDAKIDDGLPLSGKIRPLTTSGAPNQIHQLANGGCFAAGVYLSTSALLCALRFEFH